MGENPFIRILKDELSEREVSFEADWDFIGVHVPISFPAQKLAVFVDPCAGGCGCPEHYLGAIETDKDEPFDPGASQEASVAFGPGADGYANVGDSQGAPSPFGPDPTRCSAHIEQENHRLADAGWKVMRFWEHEVDRSPDEVARRIYDQLNKA
jgi:hypothetical protein